MFDFDILHPFDSFNTDSHYNGKFNGATGWIMQSDVYTNQLIEAFEEAIQEGYNPNEVKEEIFEQLGINESDLTPFDQKRLVKEVEKFYKSTYNSLF